MSTFQTIMENIQSKLEQNAEKKAKLLEKPYVSAWFSELLEHENAWNFYESLRLRLQGANDNHNNFFNRDMDYDEILIVYQVHIDSYKDKLLKNLYTDGSSSQMSNAVGQQQRSFASHVVQHQEYNWAKLIGQN